MTSQVNAVLAQKVTTVVMEFPVTETAQELPLESVPMSVHIALGAHRWINGNKTNLPPVRPVEIVSSYVEVPDQGKTLRIALRYDLIILNTARLNSFYLTMLRVASVLLASKVIPGATTHKTTVNTAICNSTYQLDERGVAQAWSVPEYSEAFTADLRNNS